MELVLIIIHDSEQLLKIIHEHIQFIMIMGISILLMLQIIKLKHSKIGMKMILSLHIQMIN